MKQMKRRLFARVLQLVVVAGRRLGAQHVLVVGAMLEALDGALIAARWHSFDARPSLTGGKLARHFAPAGGCCRGANPLAGISARERDIRHHRNCEELDGKPDDADGDAYYRRQYTRTLMPKWAVVTRFALTQLAISLCRFTFS